MSISSAPRRGRKAARRAAIASTLAVAGVVAAAASAFALTTTYGAESHCQLSTVSGSASIQAFVGHNVVVTYEKCSRFATSSRPSAAKIAYVKLLITAPSANPAGASEKITIEAGDWFTISNGLDVRYTFTVNQEVLKVPGFGNDFSAHVDALANSSHQILFCFGRTCVGG